MLAALIVAISSAYVFLPRTELLWSRIFQYLYFLPIVLAAFWFGWKGGVAAAVFAAVSYLPEFLIIWRREPDITADQVVQAVELLLVGSVLGVLADRERRQKRALQLATEQLGRTYRQLQENFEQLKRAERLSAVGQLSANLAHEIRNPLASIEGAAELLQPGAVSSEMQAEFVGIIRKECRRLSRLLTDMLDFARPKAPRYEHTSIAEVIESVVSLMAIPAQKAGVRIRLEVPPELPEIPCDREQIRQVLVNLTMNAVQAMPDGGTVELSAEVAGSRLIVSVKDEGIGVPLDALDELFSPFYTTKKDGTGLGLSVAQQIVAAHGGEFLVNPNTPKGSVFSFSLPLNPVPGRRETVTTGKPLP
jgi:two-component system sensor histidine kinase HydH